MFTPYIVWCRHDGLSSAEWIRHWAADIRASMADTLSHAVGCGDRVATGNFADTKAGTSKASHWVCECAANRTEPRALRSLVAGAMAGRKRCAPRNPGSN